MATLQSLPLELFVAIFEQLDALSLVSAAKVCNGLVRLHQTIY
jgi:hypothetical protein